MSSAAFHSGIAYNSHDTASKAALIGFPRALATEVGQHGVTVNAIAPGLVSTKTTETGPHAQWFEVIAQQEAIKRTEVADDLVCPVAFLASDDAASLPGRLSWWDGGWRLI